MAGLTIGDSALQFQNARQTYATKTRMQVLTKEMSSGKVADLTVHLQGDMNRIAGIDHEIAALDSYLTLGQDLGRFMGQQQIVLGAVNDLRTDLGTQFMTISATSGGVSLIESATAGRAGFETLVANYNMTYGGRSLFSGAAVDQPALASADDMMADIVATIGGATTEAAITAAVDFWFDDPSGGFATMGYLGDTGDLPKRKIGPNDTIEMLGRANDPAMRDVLKGMALAAVVKDMGGFINVETQAALFQQAGLTLNAAGSPLIQMAAQIGGVEQRLEDVNTMQSNQRSSFAMAHNALTVADPFETATKLQEVQQQLELQFTLISRLSRLSLVNFL